MRGWLSGIINSLTNLKESISSLPEKLKELLQSIFVPDQNELKETITTFTENLNHTFNLAIDSKDWLVDSFTEQAIEDEKSDYYINGVGTLNLTFFDTSFLKRGIEYFRPIIRGFIVLLLVFFNYKQVLTFIGQDPGMYERAKSAAEEAKQ